MVRQATLFQLLELAASDSGQSSSAVASHAVERPAGVNAKSRTEIHAVEPVGSQTSRDIDKLLLTEREAARMLSISPRKLWELRMQGAIPHVRLGRAVRYAPERLKAWIAAQSPSR